MESTGGALKARLALGLVSSTHPLAGIILPQTNPAQVAAAGQQLVQTGKAVGQALGRRLRQAAPRPAASGAAPQAEPVAQVAVPQAVQEVQGAIAEGTQVGDPCLRLVCSHAVLHLLPTS